MALQLRSPEDVKRLFSALGSLPPDPAQESLADIDALSLQPVGALDGVETNSLALSLLVALATGWVAIRAYERSRSLGVGLAWASFGYLLPLPAIAASYYSDIRSTRP